MLGLSGIVSVILLLPYVAWGVHTLRKRYILREEIPLRTAGITLAALVVFYAVEIAVSNVLLSQDRLIHIMAILGLIVSGAALYGPLLNDFCSRIIVELVTQGHESAPDQPRFGPAEALEYHGDDEGALKEYIIIARIYPWHPDVYLRIAEVCLRNKNYDEAIAWLDRGLKRVNSARQCLPLLLRLCDVFSDHMDQPDRGRRILDDFAARFPNSQEGNTVRERLIRHRGDFCAQVSSLLEDMEEISLAHASAGAPATGNQPGRRTSMALEPLDSAAPNRTEAPQPHARNGSSIKIEPLDHNGKGK